jgi:putative Mg2+ transporter-C (MgtC) family protein
LFIGLDDLDQVGRIVVRLGLALLLGAALGYEREREGKAAGLRTHMLVSLGAALFMVTAIEAEVPVKDLSRIIEGLPTGIGFLGAGAILKLSEDRKIEGLTTAANIWVAAAVGLTAGMGLLWPAVLVVLLAWFILAVVRWYDPPNQRM